VSTFGRLWLWLRNSLWFVPTLIVVGSMIAALVLVDSSGYVDDDLVKHWPRVFGAGADGSREMLAAIATSMITVAGVVFSITIVALSLASTQYSPRVLRNFMRDRPTQVVLGAFVGSYAYCLLVLRTVRGGDDLIFIPALAVLGAMVYAFVAIALLIYFIHHVAQSIQASAILGRIFDDASASVDDMFPETVGAPAAEQAQGSISLPRIWSAVTAQRNGYVTAVAGKPLLELAVECGRVLRLRVGTGDFVLEGSVLAELEGSAEVSPELAARLRKLVALGRQRTPEQDPAFGIQQMVDIAVKALSPGINDPTTACMCLDQLGALVVRLSGRRMPDARRMEGDRLRLILPVPDFRSLADLAFVAIIYHSRGDVQVLCRVLNQLDAAEARITDARRRRVLSRIAAAVVRKLGGAERSVEAVLARRRGQRLVQKLRGSASNASAPAHGAQPG